MSKTESTAPAPAKTTAAAPAKAVPAAPAIAGSRTLAQLEALAKKRAGHPVPDAELAPCDRKHR